MVVCADRIEKQEYMQISDRLDLRVSREPSIDMSYSLLHIEPKVKQEDSLAGKTSSILKNAL